MARQKITRREFIERSTSGALGVTLGAGLAADPSKPEVKKEPPKKSRVVLVRHPKVIDSAGAVQKPLLMEMLDTALTRFTGNTSVADSWGEFLKKEDSIGLKVNPLGLNSIEGTPAVSHFTCMTEVLIASCGKAGLKEKQFLIWDRSEEELKRGGFAIQKEAGKLRVMGTKEARKSETGIGFGTESFPVGEKSTRLTKILTELTSATINIPVLKHHRLSGVTGSLKNNYGSIDNAREFHENFCTGPGIPEINAVPAIRDTQRLVIADALLGVYEGGPRWNRDVMWAYGGILVGTDPVAVDRVLLTILNEKRNAEEMEPIGESHARHLELSEKLGLGMSRLDGIELVKVDLA